MLYFYSFFGGPSKEFLWVNHRSNSPFILFLFSIREYVSWLILHITVEPTFGFRAVEHVSVFKSKNKVIVFPNISLAHACHIWHPLVFKEILIRCLVACYYTLNLYFSFFVAGNNRSYCLVLVPDVNTHYGGIKELCFPAIFQDASVLGINQI